jgi:hypothetical protein
VKTPTKKTPKKPSRPAKGSALLVTTNDREFVRCWMRSANAGHRLTEFAREYGMTYHRANYIQLRIRAIGVDLPLLEGMPPRTKVAEDLNILIKEIKGENKAEAKRGV